MIKSKLFLCIMLLLAAVMNAQEVKVISGNFDFLKDQPEVNVVLQMDKTLYQVENKTEAQYLERRKNDILADGKKNESEWENWSSEWERFKKEEYIQFFLKGANLNGKAKAPIFVQNQAAKYTLIVQAKWIYAGWHAGIVGQEAKLSAELIFVETGNPSNILLQITADEILGKKQNKYFVMEYGRIAGAYENTGIEVRKQILKAIK